MFSRLTIIKTQVTTYSVYLPIYNTRLTTERGLCCLSSYTRMKLHCSHIQYSSIVVCLRFSTDTFIIATSEYPRVGFLVLLHIRCVPYNSLPNAPAKDTLHALYQHHKRKGTTNLGNTYQQSENVWDRWHLFELLENVSRRQATSAVHR